MKQLVILLLIIFSGCTVSPPEKCEQKKPTITKDKNGKEIKDGWEWECHENGAWKKLVQWDDGVAKGTPVSWHPNGVKSSETALDKTTRWHDNGKKAYESNMGTITRPAKGFIQNRKSFFKNGYPEWEQNWIYEDATTMLKHGEQKEWFDEKGQWGIKSIENFSYDIQVGKQTYYHEIPDDGTDSAVDDAIQGEATYDEKGRLHGLHTIWYGPNPVMGQPWFQKKLEQNWNAGVLDGLKTEYHRNGKKRFKGMMKNVKKEGAWLKFNKYGLRHHVECYKNGQSDQEKWEKCLGCSPHNIDLSFRYSDFCLKECKPIRESDCRKKYKL
jgi:antitoxin component YwqK of YwqJK toxin-antitoxin module